MYFSGQNVNMKNSVVIIPANRTRTNENTAKPVARVMVIAIRFRRERSRRTYRVVILSWLRAHKKKIMELLF